LREKRGLEKLLFEGFARGANIERVLAIESIVKGRC